MSSVSPARSAEAMPEGLMAPRGQTDDTAVSGRVRGDPGACAQAPGSPAIYAIELRKRYRRTVALAGLSMTVERGEVFGFLGPNGAGKTTAVKLLLGLVRPRGHGAGRARGGPADPPADRLPA